VRVLAFDIETAPDTGNLSYRDYLYLQKRGRRERSEEEMEREIALNPFTLFVVSFSVVVVEDGNIGEGVVVYLSDLNNEPKTEEIFYEEGKSVEVSFVPLRTDFIYGKLYEKEEELLKTFWEHVDKANRIVSFNGYSFDGYVLKIRSMIHEIDIPPKFLANRSFHIDLMQFLSNGERERRYTFDFVCRRFGIHTPKDIIDGSRVPEEFYKGNFFTVAQYNLKDSLALAQLYLKLKKYFKEEATLEEPPTESQMKFLVDLISELTNLSPEGIQEVVVDFVGTEGLTKRNISVLIEIFRRLKRTPY